MKHQLILARAIGYNCAALIVNQVVVAEANSTAEIDKLVASAARQLSVAMGEPLVECNVDVPVEMDGKWVWSDLVELLPPVQEQKARHELVIYCWSEGGVHPATVDGPGDAWDELCFDTQAPIAGTPLFHARAVASGGSQERLGPASRAGCHVDFGQGCGLGAGYQLAL